MAKHSFEEMVTLTPAFGPLNADEEPTQEEIDALDDINAEVLNFIHGDNNAAVMGMISNAPELYLGISQATFQILFAIKQKFEAGGELVPPAALFGEGAAIHTTIDEIWQLAQAAGLEGSDDQDQYNAAMMNVMKMIGEHIETTNDDASVGETQELLIDIETANQTGELDGKGDQESLEAAIQRSLDTQNQALQPQQAEEQAAPPEEALPPQGGGVLNV